MTPQQLKSLCEQHGGQAQVARTTGFTKDHINKMCAGKYPITAKAAKLFELLFSS